MLMNGKDHILNDILKDVEKDGYASIDWLILRNACFKDDPSKELNDWAKQNNLRYEEIIIPDKRSKNRKKQKSVISFRRI